MGELWTPDLYRERGTPPTGDVEVAGLGLARLVELFRPHPDQRGARWYLGDEPTGISIIATMDNTPRHGRLLHVSLSRADRNPSWKEIKAVREAFFPSDVDCMMVLPREADYVNLHEYCFHIWQTPTAWALQ